MTKVNKYFLRRIHLRVHSTSYHSLKIIFWNLKKRKFNECKSLLFHDCTGDSTTHVPVSNFLKNPCNSTNLQGSRQVRNLHDQLRSNSRILQGSVLPSRLRLSFPLRCGISRLQVRLSLRHWLPTRLFWLRKSNLRGIRLSSNRQFLASLG